MRPNPPWLLALLLWTTALNASPLPEPLHLQQALRLAAQTDHPELLKARARLAAGLAQRDLAERANDLEANLSAGLRLVDPASRAADQTSNDSYLRLSVSKRLYDFGRQQAGQALAEAQIAGSQLHLLNARQQRRLEVMQCFFAVLLADLRHERNSEAMAVAYVGLDKARSRQQQQQLSELDLMRQEQAYQLSQQHLKISDNARRSSRHRLALALNRPGQLSARLEPGKLSGLRRAIPALEGLIEQALSDSPLLAALRSEIRQQRQRVKQVIAEQRPSISGSLGATAYARQMGSYSPLTAELTLQIPLFAGARNRAEQAQAESEVLLKSAELKAAELELRHRLTQLWSELHDLQARRAALQQAADYHELNLDRSRALYQMEVSTDLGDAMLRISQQRLDEAELNYRAELVWAEIDALGGRLSKRNNPG
ncbi:TolC family protein [Magnetovirga frankeli]|uniref:TolC family protein n=1 Tax=Magnetovirga frankeli TaxID=947516 RepID=UPI001293F386|nr:TolC family protein [gamma proteobacterium SS-5]